MKSVILASGNKGKLKELQIMLKGLNLSLESQPSTKEFEVEETGTTFVENAIIKARHAAKLSGLPAIADDSGLVVEALDGRPGIKTARFAGKKADSNDNMDLVLKGLINYKELKQRSACFICVLVYMRSENDPLPLIATGEWQGAISLTKSGAQGFGYDPIFWSFEENMAVAEMSPETKQKYSHRSKAVNSLRQQLKLELN